MRVARTASLKRRLVVEGASMTTENERLRIALDDLGGSAERLLRELGAHDQRPFVVALRAALLESRAVQQDCVGGLTLDDVYLARLRALNGRAGARTLANQLAEALSALTAIVERAGLTNEPALTEAQRVQRLATKTRSLWTRPSWSGEKPARALRLVR
jgi:hypothetical protein